MTEQIEQININKLTLDELINYKNQFEEYMALSKVDAKPSAEQLKSMYRYYNHIFGKNENAIWCSSCRQKVWKGIKAVQFMLDIAIKNKQ